MFMSNGHATINSVNISTQDCSVQNVDYFALRVVMSYAVSRYAQIMSFHIFLTIVSVIFVIYKIHEKTIKFI